MAEQILRFHTSDKVFHTVNAIAWFALLFTGMYVYLGKPADCTAETLMVAHLWLGVLFTFNAIGYIVFAPDRFFMTMFSLLEWNANTFAWFKNFGGYPRRFFKIPFGPVEVAPQYRYNAGQKASYLLFFIAIFGLVITGWLLWYCAPMIGKDAFKAMWYFHVWGSMFISLLVVCAHIPLALCSMPHFLGIWRIGLGTIPVEAAEHHSPLWFKRDVMKISD